MSSTVVPGEEVASTTVRLHKRETSGSGYWGHPGICTVTFCEGAAASTTAAVQAACGRGVRQEYVYTW